VRVTVKRSCDTLGIAPDNIEVDAGEGDDVENAKAWRALLKGLTVEARIERCKRHPDLIQQAEALHQRALDMGSATSTGWMDWQFRAQYENLERAAAELDIASIRPLAQSEKARVAGASKSRGSRMPLLDDWIRAQNLDRSNDELWHSLPEETEGDDLYRDGDKLVELKRNGREHSIQRGGFNKRIADVRKKRR